MRKTLRRGFRLLCGLFEEKRTGLREGDVVHGSKSRRRISVRNAQPLALPMFEEIARGMFGRGSWGGYHVYQLGTIGMKFIGNGPKKFGKFPNSQWVYMITPPVKTLVTF